MKKTTKAYDVVVVGGGMSGICAAIAAAREGVNTALINNRPVLGGNASSEIRMHICGADQHEKRKNARETGIIEEILLENRKRNPQNSYSVFDTILWEKVTFQENLDLYLNTHITKVNTMEQQIESIEGVQLSTETEIIFISKIFADCTGDGAIAHLSGATTFLGRESKYTYNEPDAPEVADTYTMGNTLLFTTKDMGQPVEFEKPHWANSYTEDDLFDRKHGAHGINYWWIELGGKELETIKDGEFIRDELIKAVYGVWDHIKNYDDHGADNYALDWIGFLPGKRESRRVLGDYILTQNDLAESKHFEDTIAYGGWSMDMHTIGGLTSKYEPTVFIDMKDLYAIPYRAIYSKDIYNLYIGGRNISASHMAFGSTRVMATCAVIGQAIGVSSAYAIKKNIPPKQVINNISEIQKTLIYSDCFLPNIKIQNNNDYALNSTITASSSKEGHFPENIINGYSRNINDDINLWASSGFSSSGEWLKLSLGEAKDIENIKLKFDSNLSKQIMISHFTNNTNIQTPIELVKNYTIKFYNKGLEVYKHEVFGNYQRFNDIKLENIVIADEIELLFLETNGINEARLFEINIL